MKRWIVLGIAILFTATMVACSAKKEEDQTKTEKNTSDKVFTPAQIEAAIAVALADDYHATVDVPKEEMGTCPMRNVDLSKLDSYVAKISPIPSIQMDSVMIATAKDASYAEKLVELFNKDYERATCYADAYPMEPHKLAESRIFRVGNTVMYIIAGRSPEPTVDDRTLIQWAQEGYQKVETALSGLYGFVPENLKVEPEDTGDANENESAAVDFDSADIDQVAPMDNASEDGAPKKIWGGANVGE